MSKSWLDAQTIKVKKSSISKPWYSMKVLNGGTVCIPEYDLEIQNNNKYKYEIGDVIKYKENNQVGKIFARESSLQKPLYTISLLYDGLAYHISEDELEVHDRDDYQQQNMREIYRLQKLI